MQIKSRIRNPQKTRSGLTLHATGQYRIDTDGVTLYLGTDAKQAEQQYDLYRTTGLRWTQKYHQFTKTIDGDVRSFGNTAEEARANYERFISQRWRDSHQVEPAPIIATSVSVAESEFSVNAVEDVANAYVAWCIANRSAKHAQDAKAVFKHLAKYLGRNTLVASLTAARMANYRQHCLDTVNSRFNKHMRVIKAVSTRKTPSGPN